MLCPQCGHDSVRADFTCHTYPADPDHPEAGWLACMGCDSAVSYYCNCRWTTSALAQKDGCQCIWEYTDGLNPRSPRAEANAKARPSWLSEQPLRQKVDIGSVMVKHKDVPWSWDSDEEDEGA